MSTNTEFPCSATRASFVGAIRSEWIKFRGLISNQMLVFSTFMLITVNAILMPLAYVYRDRSSVQANYNAYPEMVIDKTGYLGILLAILAGLLITNEYRSGQIKTTFLSIPRRITVLLAKVVLVIGIGIVVGVVSAGIGFVLAPVILSTGGYEYVLAPGLAIRLILGSGLYLATLSIIGLALGALIRNVVGSVLSILVFLLVVPVLPQIFSATGAEITKFFPIQAGSLLVAPPASGGFEPWSGYLVLVVWAVVSLFAAAVTLKRRDA